GDAWTDAGRSLIGCRQRNAAAIRGCHRVRLDHGRRRDVVRSALRVQPGFGSAGTDCGRSRRCWRGVGAMRVCVFAWLVASVIMTAAPARAQAALQGLPSQVTLDDVLKLLEDRSPQTIAGRASIAVAAADRITAATLPNPTVSYGGVHLAAGLSTGAITQ